MVYILQTTGEKLYFVTFLYSPPSGISLTVSTPLPEYIPLHNTLFLLTGFDFHFVSTLEKKDIMTNINSTVGGVYTKMKTGAGNAGRSAKQGAGKTGQEAKAVLANLVIYAATIIIALAWNEFFVALFGEIFGFDTLWILYLYAFLMIGMPS